VALCHFAKAGTLKCSPTYQEDVKEDTKADADALGVDE
jgi:hypothetical protein